MDESIFPEEITDEMQVADYKMVYYDPWDAQFLSYLVVEYDGKAYNAEVERLKGYDSTEYTGYYGAEGFSEGYTLLAVEADVGAMRHARRYAGLLYDGSMPFGKSCRHDFNERGCPRIKRTWKRKG